MRARSIAVMLPWAMVTILTTAASAAAQVIEGDTEVINVRETDPTLGPLVFTLVGLGMVALVATGVFWWSTRPPKRPNWQGKD